MYSGAPNYKRTTGKQYSLLKHKMSILTKHVKNYQQNNLGTYKQDKLHWEELTEKLNKLGPPYRTLQQWRKVWSDFRRSENKRKFNSKAQRTQNVQKETKHDNARELDEELEQETCESQYDIATSSKVNSNIKTEPEDDKYDTQTVETTFSNEYDNEYTYPEEQESYVDETNILIPDESSCGSYTCAPPKLKRKTQHTSVNQTSADTINYATPPPLTPSNALLMDQTLYTLQNQMEHQTKLLEHLSQMSSTMTGLMERQVNAVEKQTASIHRQAFALEHHTFVMNSFMDMIREKMLKGNSQKTTAASLNSVNKFL